MEPVREIKTERLSVRRVRAEDWAAVRAMWAAVGKTAYARYDTPKDTAEEAVRRRVERWASFADSAEHRFFAVCFEDRFIGYISLNRREYGYELGYCFDPAFHGRGFAGESIRAALGSLSEEGSALVTAGTALDNGPSVRLLLALGFELTGTERVSFYKDAEGNDIFFDGGIFSLRLTGPAGGRGKEAG